MSVIQVSGSASQYTILELSVPQDAVDFGKAGLDSYVGLWIRWPASTAADTPQSTSQAATAILGITDPQTLSATEFLTALGVTESATSLAGRHITVVVPWRAGDAASTGNTAVGYVVSDGANSIEYNVGEYASIAGFRINATSDDDTITTGDGGDIIRGGGGDDVMDFGTTGSSGNEWQNRDIAVYQGSWLVPNRATGAMVSGFSLEQLPDGSIRVKDLIVGNVDEGTDILRNVDVIRFEGDGTEILIAPQINYHMWGAEDARWRKLDVQGGVFDDTIQGTQFQDYLDGGDGNDVILGGALDPDALITIAGGNSWSSDLFGHGVAKLDDNNLIDTGVSLDLGLQSRVRFFADKDVEDYVPNEVAGDISGAVHLHIGGTDPLVVQAALDGASTVPDVVAAVETLRADGAHIEILISHSFGPVDGYVLADLTEVSNNKGGDEIRGGAGNDFIDGGAQGIVTDPNDTWSKSNRAQFSGREAEYIIQQFTLTADLSENAFDDGSSVAEFASEFDVTAGTIGKLLAALDLPVSDYATLGDKVTLVADTIANRDGIDAVVNIQVLNFQDVHRNLEMRVQPSNYGSDQPNGFYIEGTAFNDQAIDGENDLDLSGRDDIYLGAGNDIVVAGASGDHINVGSGFNFVDGGTSGTSTTDTWGNANELRIDGTVSRFDLARVDYDDAVAFLTQNMNVDASRVTELIGSDSSRSFLKVSDKVTTAGQGQTLFTNIDRVSFNDDFIEAQVTANAWQGGQTNDRDATTLLALNNDVELQGTQFADSVDLSDAKWIDFFFDESDIRWADVFDLRASEAGFPEGTTIADIDYFLNKVQFRAGAGDDVFIGNEHGSYLKMGAGNDVVDAKGQLMLPDGAFGWITMDSLSFSGAIERYVIAKVTQGDIVTKSGMVVSALEYQGAVEDILYDLSDLETVGVRDGAGKVILATPSETTGFIVRDRLPAEFGGEGIDLAFGVEDIDFNNSNIETVGYVEFRYRDWLRDGVDQLHVRAPYFGGTIDMGALVAEYDRGDVIDSWIDGSQFDDVVVGLLGRNEVFLRGGDDIYIDNPNGADLESQGFMDDPWDYIDNARYSGAKDRYDISNGFVKIIVGDDGQFDLARVNDEVVWYSALEAENDAKIVSAIRVADKLGAAGDGTDILIGIEELRFADDSVQMWAEANVDVWQSSWDGALALDFGIDEAVEEVVFRQTGTEVGELLEGQPRLGLVPPFYVEWEPLNIGPLTQDYLITAGLFDHIPTLGSWKGDGSFSPVGVVSEFYDRPRGTEITQNTWAMTAYLEDGALYDADDVFVATYHEAMNAALEGLEIALTDGDQLAIDAAKETLTTTLADVFGVDGAFPIIELSQTIDAKNYFALAVPELGTIGNELSFATFKLAGRDVLEGRDGDDTLIGNGGEDRFEPGLGNDIVIGSTEQAILHTDAYADPWQSDQVEYDGTRDRYLVEKLYAYVSDSTLGDLANRVSADITDLGPDPKDGSVLKPVFRVTDLATDPLINSGQDLLIDVGQIRFRGDDSRYRLSIYAEYEQADWYPDVNNALVAASGISSLAIWDATPFDDAVDLDALWMSPEFMDVRLPPLSLTGNTADYTDVGLRVGATLDGTAFVRASEGVDTYYGVTSANVHSEFRVSLGSLSDYVLTRGTDADERPYVEIALSPTSTLSKGLGVTRLYDFDRIQFEASEQRVLLGTSQDLWLLQNRQRAAVNTSIFDDVIVSDDILPIFENTDLNPAVLSVMDNQGNDTYLLGDYGDMVLVDLGPGDDRFDLGSGFDVVYTTAPAASFDISYFKTENGKQVEISRQDFITNGIAGFYDAAGNEIDYQTFVDTSTAHLAINYNYRLLGSTWPDPVLHNDTLGEPGYFEYVDGYSIQLADNTVSNRFGTDVLIGVDAIWLGEGVYDILTDRFLLTYDVDDMSIVDGKVVVDPAKLADSATIMSPVPITPSVKAPYDMNALSEAEIDEILTSSYSSTEVVAGSDETAKYYEFRIVDDTSSRVYLGTSGLLGATPGSDDFRDRFGDDVYHGNGQYLGTVDAPVVTRNDWSFGDKVRFDDVQDRFEISYHRLNAQGKIEGLTADDTWFDTVIGDPYQSYVRVADKDQTPADGYGVNYLFDVSRIVFSDTNIITGVAVRYDDPDDRPSSLRLSTSPLDDFVDMTTNPYAQTLLTDGILTSVQFEATGGVDFFAGMDNLGSAADLWDLDRLRVNDLMQYFDVTRGWIQRDADGEIVTSGPYGYAEFYDIQDDAALVAGGYWVEAARVSDNRVGAEKRYDDIIISDIEVVSFVDEGYAIAVRDEIGFGTYDLWLGDAQDVPMGQWLELRTEVQSLGVSYTFDGVNFAGQSIDDIGIAYDTPALSYRVWSGGAYDDEIVVLGTEQRVEVDGNGGNDYVYLGNHSGSEVDYSGVSSIRLSGLRSQYTIQQVWVALNDDYTPQKDAAGDWITSTVNGDGLTAAVLISDTSGTEGGRKLVVGLGRAYFDDTRVTLNQRIETDDWDEDGSIDYMRYEGTDFDDLIVYDPAYDGDETIEEEFEGTGGNDTLVGGAGGDRFRGGLGDDVIFGGANGTGDEWRANDRVDYWDRNAQDFDISRAIVGVNYDTHSVLKDASGQVILNPSSDQLGADYTAVQGVFVKDLLGEQGTDLLIDVERLDVSGRGFTLNITTRSDDWNNDGVIDYARVSGTDFDDIISEISVDPGFLAFDNDIDAGQGNDVIHAGAGGDYIRPSAGNDIIFGGADGQENEWGWVRRDEVRFDNPYARYDITTYDWDLTLGAQSLVDADGVRAFAIDTDGKIYRNDDGTDVLVGAVSAGDRIAVVRDKMPSDPLLGGDGVNVLVGVENLSFEDKWMGLEVEYNIGRDAQGALQWSWIRGTEFNDTLTGTLIGDGFQDGAGDDVLIGGQGSDNFNINAGNDTVYGDLVDGSLESDDHDSVRFDANFDQFIVNATVDETGRRYVFVKDTIPGEFGLGENRLYDIEGLSFADRYLNVGVNFDRFDNDNGTSGTHINGSVFNDTIRGTVNGDTFWTGEGDDLLYGGKGADFFTPGAGNDTVFGGDEGLSPWGYDDVDTVHFDYKYSEVTVQYFDASGAADINYDKAGHIVVTYSNGTDIETDTLYGIERLTFYDRNISFAAAYGFENGKYVWKGTEEDDSGNVNFSDQNERFYGYAGNDKLEGGVGDDDFIGGAGNDTLYGNTDGRTDDLDEIGNPFVDTAIYEGNFADYTVTSAGDAVWTVSENTSDLNDDTDTLYDIEVLRFADRSEWLVQNIVSRDTDRDGKSDLVLVQGTIGNDAFDMSDYENIDMRVYGGAGNDSAVFNDNVDVFVMDTVGVNSYTAGSGLRDVAEFDGKRDDWSIEDNGDAGIVVSKGTDKTTLLGFERIVFADSTYNLVLTQESVDRNGDGVTDLLAIEGADTGDDIVATGAVAVQVNGNAGDDTITTGAGGDTISGGAGSDLIDGGGGFDTYVTTYQQSDIEVTALGTDQFKLYNTVTDETDLITNIERLQFADAAQRLKVVESVYQDFVVGEGFKDITKIVATVYDDVIEASTETDSVIVTGEGQDRVIIDAASSFDVSLSDFDVAQDTFVFVSQDAIADASQMSVRGQGANTIVTLASGGEVAVRGAYGTVENGIQTVDLNFDGENGPAVVTKITAGGSNDIISATSALGGDVVVTTGDGEDVITLDGSQNQHSVLLDLNATNDTLVLNNAAIASVTADASGLSMTLGSGGVVDLANVVQGQMALSINSVDSFVFNDANYNANRTFVAPDATDEVTLIVDVDDPAQAQLDWQAANETVLGNGATYAIGTGTFTIEWSDPATSGIINLEFI